MAIVISAYASDNHNMAGTMLRKLSKVENSIADSVRLNSILFLQRAAAEIAAHEEVQDSPFDPEVGTIVTVLTQMSLELALAAFLIKNNGVRAILESSKNLSDDEINAKWLSNELRTKRFEDNKKFFSSAHPALYAVFQGVVEQFQRTRNKIVHFHFNFDEGDLYDLKYESTYILIHVVSSLLFDDDLDHASQMSSLLPGETFPKLIAFPPYLFNVKKMAEAYSSVVLRCPLCNHVTFSDIERKCFACTYDDPSADLVICRHCSTKAVIYDHLNFSINESVPALCLNCSCRSVAFECKDCGLLSTGKNTSDCKFCAEV